MLNAALKEVNELQSQNELLTKALVHSNSMLFNFYKNIGSMGAKSQYDRNIDVLVKPPEQCLKQHNIDLLNSLKDDFINSNQSCELVLATMIHSLECDNGTS